MGFIKRKIKKFDYNPRYYKGEGNPFEIKQKFDDYRGSLGGKGLKTKFINALTESKSSKDKGFNKTTIIVIFLLILIFLFIIDFDLSIFLNN
ncbi:MAG: riboflavin synthase subunit beta [Flavobacteriaceae bacterium]|nr:riboflavin synthase subunit beta [Flavobacteriaceae bacterium]